MDKISHARILSPSRRKAGCPPFPFVIEDRRLRPGLVSAHEDGGPAPAVRPTAAPAETRRGGDIERSKGLQSGVRMLNESQKLELITQIVLDSNSAPDYAERLAAELAEMRDSEMWRAGKAVRSLRPENWGKTD